MRSLLKCSHLLQQKLLSFPFFKCKLGAVSSLILRMSSYQLYTFTIQATDYFNIFLHIAIYSLVVHFRNNINTSSLTMQSPLPVPLFNPTKYK